MTRPQWTVLAAALLALVVAAARADEPAPAAPGAPGAPVPETQPPAPFPGRAERLETRLTAAKSYRTQTDPALHDALHWLAAHQSPNGRWEAAGFDRWCDGAKNEGVKPDGAGDKAHDVGVTGLALCAFLGAGYTHRGEHEFQKVVRKGLAFLTEAEDEEGLLGRRDTLRFIYNHATATLALVEAYGMTEDAALLPPAQKAIQFIEFARNPYFAWRYGVKPGDNDTSVMGWMSHVLASARIVNEHAAARGKPEPLKLDPDVAEGIDNWCDKMTDPDYARGGYCSRGQGPYRPPELVDRFPQEYSEGPTAMILLARLFHLRHVPAASPKRLAAQWDLVLKGIELCGRLSPAWSSTAGSIDMTYWYFAALALHQAAWDMGPKSARDLWPKWNKALLTALLENQRKDGTHCGFKGSWDPLDPWGDVGGRVYSTALCALCLETPYRYPRVLAKPR